MTFVLNLPYNANLTPFRSEAHPSNAVFCEKLNNSLTPEIREDPPGSFGVPENRDEKGVGHHTNPDTLAPSPPRKGTNPHDSTG